VLVEDVLVCEAGEAVRSQDLTPGDLRLPGTIRQLNQHATRCDTNPSEIYDAVTQSAVRDRTGDGVPDFIERDPDAG
jgi:hypothetical protein